jgi:hypothetical protein
MFHWNTDYAVGIRQVDEEHQQLFVLAERLHRAMLEGNGKAILVNLLSRLVDYTCYHFVHEEQLMEGIHYPGYRPHQQGAQGLAIEGAGDAGSHGVRRNDHDHRCLTVFDGMGQASYNSERSPDW